MNTGLFRVIVCFIFLTVTITGCTPQQNKPAEKDSLQAAEYRQAGFPDTLKKWLPAGYTAAYNGLLLLKNKRTAALPRLKSGPGTGLLKKLFNVKELATADSGMSSLQQRFEYTMTVFPAIRNSTMLYYQASSRINGRLELSNEIVAGHVAMLCMLEKQALLAESFMKAGTGLNETQLQGFQKLKDGLSTSFTGTLITIKNEYRLYEREDIEKLAGYFFAMYQRVYSFLDAGARTKLEEIISGVAAGHEYSAVENAARGANK